jgi:hypothetical protein
MRVLATCPIVTTPFSKVPAHRIVFVLAIRSRPWTLTFKVKTTHLFFTIRSLGWRSGLTSVLCFALGAFTFSFVGLACLASFTGVLSSASFAFSFALGIRNCHSVAARKMLGHLVAGPLKAAFLKEFSN